MAEFALAYAPVKNFEGGWCDDFGDKGGETFCGCARNFFPTNRSGRSSIVRNRTLHSNRANVPSPDILRLCPVSPVW